VSLSDAELISVIPDWFAVTKGQDVNLGLSREEAVRRARLLRRLIEEGEVRPQQVVVDEELKDVFHALLALMSQGAQGGSALAQEANRLYLVIRDLPWPDDILGEQQALLKQCAEIGLQALEQSLSELEDLRRAFLNGDNPSTLAMGCLEVTERDVVSFCQTRLDVTLETNIVWQLCDVFRTFRNTLPRAVERFAARTYERLSNSQEPVGLFDQMDFFLGYSAYLAASTSRILGSYDESLAWLERAEAKFSKTLMPALLLAEIAAERTALEYDRKDYVKTARIARTVRLVCERVGLWRATLKCRVVEASVLKEQQRFGDSLAIFGEIRSDARLRNYPALHAAVLVKSMNVLLALKRRSEAVDLQREALRVAQESNQPMAIADLKAVIGEALRDQGLLAEAATAYRQSIDDYARIGMSTYEAYVRVVLAETLLAMSQFQEAEKEILAAMPTIEKEQMVREGAAALKLLRDCGERRRMADPTSLRELRRLLQKRSHH
jgi:tetratricopeptide (TPR) repeat protein